jgi:hypothetical protein
MEAAVELEVPTPSDISLGADWGTLTKVEKSDSFPEERD